MTSLTREANLKGNIFRLPIHPQSFKIVMAFGTEGDKTDQEKPSLKTSTFTPHTYSVLALIFHALGFPLNFTAGTGIWPKIRLGNGIYTPPSGPSFKVAVCAY